MFMYSSEIPIRGDRYTVFVMYLTREEDYKDLVNKGHYAFQIDTHIWMDIWTPLWAILNSQMTCSIYRWVSARKTPVR